MASEEPRSPPPEPPSPPGPELPAELDPGLSVDKPTEEGPCSKIGSSLKKPESSAPPEPPSSRSDDTDEEAVSSVSSLSHFEVSISGGISFFEQAVVKNTQNTEVTITFQFKAFIINPRQKNFPILSNHIIFCKLNGSKFQNLLRLKNVV